MLWDRDCGIWVEADEDICDGPEYLVFVTEKDATDAAAYLGFDCYPVQVKGSEAERPSHHGFQSGPKVLSDDQQIAINRILTGKSNTFDLPGKATGSEAAR